MKRPVAPILPFALLLLAAPAAAQDECGTQDDPCPWVLDVDADGFQWADGVGFEATQGDWVMFDLQNFDTVDHTVRLEGYGLEWTVPAEDNVQSDPIELTQAGEFGLADAPSGDRGTVRVYVTDPEADDPVLDPDVVPSGTPTEEEDGEDTPGPALPLVLLGLLAAVVLRRRA